MAKSKGNKAIRCVMIVLGSTILLFLVGSISSILESTIVNQWIFFATVVAVAAATGTVLHRVWAKLTHTCKFYINFPLHLIVASIVISATMLMVNYFATDYQALPLEKVVIEKRLQKTRYHTKRVTRRVYTRGDPYKVNYLRITLPDGSSKEVYVNKKLYDKSHPGDSATIRMGRGILSIPVLYPRTLRLCQTRNQTRKKVHFGKNSGNY